MDSHLPCPRTQSSINRDYLGEALPWRTNTSSMDSRDFQLLTPGSTGSLGGGRGGGGRGGAALITSSRGGQEFQVACYQDLPKPPAHLPNHTLALRRAPSLGPREPTCTATQPQDPTLPALWRSKGSAFQGASKCLCSALFTVVELFSSN